MKIIKYSILGLLLPLSIVKSEHTQQLALPHITIAKQNSVLRKHLPNLYAALHKRKSTGLEFIEFLERVAQDHQADTSWHLAQTQQQFIGELLQMLDTIVAQQGTENLYTCTLNGNAGTLPVLLLSAGLYRLGIQDLSFQLIGNEPRNTLKKLNKATRCVMATSNDRFHLQQVASIDDLIKTSAQHRRKSNTIISFTGNNSKILAARLNSNQSLILDYKKHTIS